MRSQVRMGKHLYVGCKSYCATHPLLRQMTKFVRELKNIKENQPPVNLQKLNQIMPFQASQGKVSETCAERGTVVFTIIIGPTFSFYIRPWPFAFVTHDIISLGCEAPLLYTFNGLHSRGFPPGGQSASLFLFNPVGNHSHFLLRELGPQTQLGGCSKSCCGRQDVGEHSQSLWCLHQW